MEAVDSWRSYATICRLCLQKDGFMLGIFNHIQGKEKSIYKKIVDCTALQISFGDGLPNVICHRCLYKIEFCLEFRKLCFISDATLRQMNTAIEASTNGENLPQGINGEITNSLPPKPAIFEQLVKHNEKTSRDDVVMVVDPSAPDYESDFDGYDSDRNGGGAVVGGSEGEAEVAEVSLKDFGGKNIAMCKYCDHAFIDRNECLQHETTYHHQAMPYTCALCQMRFAERMPYSAHLKSVHQNDKPYCCPQCDRTFARRSDLRKHTVVHTGIKPYTCSICTKSFSRNTNLSKHMRIHSGQKPFVCPKCPKTFYSKGDLTRHLIIHSGQKPFKCQFCQLSFSRKDKLLRHEKRHFSGKQKEDITQNLSINQYYDQGNSFGGSQDQNHQNDDSENMVISLDPYHHNDDYHVDLTLNSDSNDEEEFAKISDDLSPLIGDHHQNGIDREDDTNDSLPQVPIHITGDSFHDDSKHLYTCNSCPKSFPNLDMLRCHQATIHLGIEPHICNVCGKTFLRKRELDRHSGTHTGMKPFKCAKCPKSFGRRDKLVRHSRVHDVGVVHSCKLCGANFNRKDLFIQHKRTHIEIDQQML